MHIHYRCISTITTYRLSDTCTSLQVKRLVNAYMYVRNRYIQQREERFGYTKCSDGCNSHCRPVFLPCLSIATGRSFSCDFLLLLYASFNSFYTYSLRWKELKGKLKFHSHSNQFQLKFPRESVLFRVQHNNMSRWVTGPRLSSFFFRHW